MLDKNTVRILTISLNAWNDTVATGNTFSNLFSGIPTENIANIYCRNESVSNNICTSYFRVTEKDILKNLFSKNKCGRQVDFEATKNTSLSVTAESGTKQKAKRFFQKYRPVIFLALRELIWDTRVWENKNLDDFVKQFNPDIIYMHGHGNLYMHKILSYCKEISGANVAVYFGDDMYGYKSYNPFRILYQTIYRRRMRKTVSQASVLFGGTKQLCDEYGKIFDREFHELYKSCSLPENTDKTGYNKPLKFVYAGNLLYGRDKVLINLKEAIERSNAENALKCQLEIYSATSLSEKETARLNSESTFFMGPRPYSEICKIMSDADVVLHVESWEKQQIKRTRLSFSTKIIDCMQSGSALFAIGPDSIASIKHIKDSNAAYCACSEQEISDTLSEIVNAPEQIAQYAKKMRQYAEDYHDAKKVQDIFYNELMHFDSLSR